ncbi:glycosyltransferase family 4 protein [Crenobacter intestini]|uniref:Glycosyltransferase family 4 protein n=1 Tax=Crenobacter intestini TaxID=2563443 RepID=A0A4T0UIZ9_9NEIS|nr:glycosyltransferase family 4 protein [Crenobacter intestini]TIC78509.1 glycosyltransferase family 4 protein [Crenobacter intestini]
MSFALIINRTSKALNFAKSNGWLNLLRLILHRLLRVGGYFGKTRIFGLYDFVTQPAIGVAARADGVSNKTINWFVPEVGKGSGGHLNIFRFIKNLEAHGFENRIVIIGSPTRKAPDRIKSEIHEWFFPVQAEVYSDAESAPPAYFTMATSWPTAYYVRAYQSTMQRCYFVQDFEPWFYPAGSDSLLAEATYGFGFQGFTAGSWLARKLSEEFSMPTCALGFSFDRELYKPQSKPQVERKHKRIFFYARPPTARRAFELGLLVLAAVSKRLPDAEIVLAGWDVRNYDIPFQVEHVGLVDLKDLPALYGGCDVALVLSCSNLSLLPLELMACGVPVVSNRAPFTEWLLNDSNAVLADATVEGLSTAIIDLLESPAKIDKIRQAGFDFACHTSWENEAKIMAEHLESLAN